MSDLDLTEARKMAAALYEGLRNGAFGDAEPAAVLTANLLPVIEAAARRDERKRIAAEMAKRAQDFDPGTWPHRAYMDAAETAGSELS